MARESSPFSGCLYYSANALSRIITKMSEEEFLITGLSPSYAFLLMLANDKPGIQPSEIAEKLMLTPSTVTRLIEKMEYQGYLKRHSEGRATLVEPTDKSYKINVRLHEAWQSLSRRYIDLLGEDMAKRLTQEMYNAAIKLEEEDMSVIGYQ